MATMVRERPSRAPQSSAPDAPSSAGVAVLRAGAAQDLGDRADQEDALGFTVPGDDPLAERGSLFVLADGLGGHAAGELASGLAVAQITQSYYAAAQRQPGNMLQSAITAAHDRIRAAAQEPGRHGMGTTCVCAAVQGDRLWVANVGDSRAYLVRPSEGVLQLTQDHSLAAAQLREGVLTPDEAANSPLRSVLLQSLGSAGTPQPYYAPPLTMHRGDLLLLCSDGLYGVLDARALRDYLLAALASMREAQPDLLARDLVAGARFHGADDNVSALIVYCAEVLPAVVAAGAASGPTRRVFLPAPLPAGGAPTLPDLPGAALPVPAAEPAPVERTLPPLEPPPPVEWAWPQAAVAAVIAPPPAPAGSGGRASLRAGFSPWPVVLHPATALLLGVFSLTGLALLAAGLVLMPFSPQWIPLLLGLIGFLGLLLLIVGAWPGSRPAAPFVPAEGPPRGARPAERSLEDSTMPDLLTPESLTADLIYRVLSDTPAISLPLRPAERALPTPDAPGVPSAAPPAPLSAAPPAPPSAPGNPAPAPPASAGAVLPPGPALAAGPSYVNQAFSEALARARAQWTFNLLVAFGTAGLIILGIAITVTWLLNGQATLYTLLFGPGATLIGIANWALTRPAAQLSRADNQISLLTLVWTNYAQELRSCAAITDPTAAAACTGHAGGDAVHYFNDILTGKSLDPPPA